MEEPFFFLRLLLIFPGGGEGDFSKLQKFGEDNQKKGKERRKRKDERGGKLGSEKEIRRRRRERGKDNKKKKGKGRTV